MKIALLQLNASEDKESNIAQALSMSEEAIANGAVFILLPEVFSFRGNTRDKKILLKNVEKIPGPSSKPFLDIAKKKKVMFLLGSVLERAGIEKVFNTSIFINAQGSIAAKYRKIHLFDARIGDKIIREADIFTPGKKPCQSIAGNLRIGLSICYDLRFPWLYQAYAKSGVDVLTVPSCFTRKTGQAHWEALLKARAIENLSYVLAPNQVGVDFRGVEAHGHSMIISPWGDVIAKASAENQEIIYGDIDIAEVKKARSILPGIIKN